MSKAWQALVDKEHEEILEILATDPFEDWARNSMPEDSASDAVRYGAELLYAGREKYVATAEAFFKQAIAVADRTVKEDKLRKDKHARVEFPKTRGLLRRAREYARGLLGVPMDLGELLAGAEDIVSWERKQDDVEDDPIHEAHWMAAARLALVADDPAAAAEVLDEAPSLGTQKREATLAKMVAAAAVEASDGPVASRTLRADVESFFDKVRSPRWRGSRGGFDEPEFQRLEWGAIRHRYFVAKDRKLDWKTVVKAIRQ